MIIISDVVLMTTGCCNYCLTLMAFHNNSSNCRFFFKFRSYIVVLLTVAILIGRVAAVIVVIWLDLVTIQVIIIYFKKLDRSSKWLVVLSTVAISICKVAAVIVVLWLDLIKIKVIVIYF